MTTQGAELLVLALAIAVGMPLIVMYVIPNASRSVYRYDMWRLHDDVMDEIRAGRLPRDSQAVRQLVESIRATIGVADRLSIPVLVSIYLGFRDTIALPERPSLATLEPGQRKAINEFEGRLVKTTVRYLLLGRPSGVVIMPLLPIAAGIDAWRRRRDPRWKRPTAVMARPVRTEMVDDDMLFRVLNLDAGPRAVVNH